MKRLSLAIALVLLALPAYGDVVYLKNGGTVEGDATQTPNGVVVKLPDGTMTFTNDQVLRVEKKPSAVGEYDQRAAGIKADDPEAHYQLGLWARSVGLDQRAREEFEKAVALKPDLAAARIALGQRLVNGRWLTEEEDMQARGFVRYDGQWMTPDAAAKIQKLKMELEIARQNRQTAEAELKQLQDKIQAEERAARRAAPQSSYANPYDAYYMNRYYNGSSYYYSYDYYVPRSYYGIPSPYPFIYVGPSFRSWRTYPGGYRSFPPRGSHHR